MFWTKLLQLKCFESAIKLLFPKRYSGSVQVLKTGDKSGQIGLFEYVSYRLKEIFLFWVLTNI